MHKNQTFILTVIFFSILLLSVLISLNLVQRSNSKPKVVVVMFGDSLTANGKWDKLFPHKNIVNLGVGGNTTYNMLKRLREVYKYHPKYCFIMAGINDLDTKREPEEIYKDYISILNKLKNKDITPIILSTLYSRDDYEAIFRLNDKVDQLNNVLKDYALTNNLIYIDLNASFTENHCLSRKYAIDQLHLNDKAYEVWKDKIKHIIYNK